jgi:hypothetical protein
MILAIGFRVRSKRGTQFRIWANLYQTNEENLLNLAAKPNENETN